MVQPPPVVAEVSTPAEKKPEKKEDSNLITVKAQMIEPSTGPQLQINRHLLKLEQ